MARRWSVPPARERGEVLLASGPSMVFHCAYTVPMALCAVFLGGLAVTLLINPGKATLTMLIIGAVLLGGLALGLFMGFVRCLWFGVKATRRGLLVRYIPGRTKFLQWEAIVSFAPGVHDGRELRSLNAQTVDGASHMMPVLYRTDRKKNFLSSKLTPEGARYVGPDVNPAVVLPRLLDLHRQGRLGA